jgi:hypothetical protein
MQLRSFRSRTGLLKSLDSDEAKLTIFLQHAILV